jgi:predicted acyl esterase
VPSIRFSVNRTVQLGTRIAPRAALAALALCALAVFPPLAAARANVAGSGAAAFAARGSVEQAYVTGLRAGQRLVLIDRLGRQVQSQRADSLGGIVFRNVQPGAGYRVRGPGSGAARSAPFTVMSPRSAPPSTGVYRQQLPASGYGYLTTRDGTKLAIDVHLPSGSGPYPTLIEYSGYGYADPAGAQSGISPIANLLGFAVVDVNMRGSGCSGGSFDYFERLQSLDGYDVIETVARQSWVLHHRVGMMGISYGGISQLFVAATDPPGLAATAPLSVIDNSATTLYPGGLLNTGFTLPWAEQRARDAQPASATTGQPWAFKQIQGGDQTCKANQVLHGEAPNLVAKVYANSHYVPSIADPVSPITFVDKINTPVYLACQWTDEQTGGHCADLAQHFTGTQRKWFTFTNGAHIDSLDPATFTRWYDFLELYVARAAPRLSSSTKALAPTIFKSAMGISGVNLPSDPIQAQPTYAAALAAFQRLPSVRILFDNGAGSSTPGAPVPGFEQSFPRFPLPGTQARSWYLARGGALAPAPTTNGGADRFTWNPAALAPTDFTGDTASGPGGLWTATPHYNWRPSPKGTALSYVTSPLGANTVVVGAGAVQAWIKASAPSVDLQVTVSEVRPDGIETFVQTGWLRTSERKLASSSTLLAPVPTFRKADTAPLLKGRWTEVTVPLYYEGHAYRRGSRIRITISAPGGNQPIWGFANTSPRGRATVELAYSRKLASRLILPVVPGIGVPTGLPPCPGLRGEPCRTTSRSGPALHATLWAWRTGAHAFRSGGASASSSLSVTRTRCLRGCESASRCRGCRHSTVG